MKLKKILEDINADSGSSPHTAYEIDEYGYEIEFGDTQKLGLRTVITGELSIQSWEFKPGETLSINYEIDQLDNKNIVEFEAKINKQHKNLQDGQFNIDEDPEDLKLLEEDINLKLQVFRKILDEKGMNVIEKIYNRLWAAVNAL